MKFIVSIPDEFIEKQTEPFLGKSRTPTEIVQQLVVGLEPDLRGKVSVWRFQDSTEEATQE